MNKSVLGVLGSVGAGSVATLGTYMGSPTVEQSVKDSGFSLLGDEDFKSPAANDGQPTQKEKHLLSANELMDQNANDTYEIKMMVEFLGGESIKGNLKTPG